MIRSIKVLLFLLVSKNLIALNASVIREQFLFEKAPFKSCHASTITEVQNGDLLCAYFAGEKEGAQKVGIWFSRLSNRKWSYDCSRENPWL